VSEPHTIPEKEWLPQFSVGNPQTLETLIRSYYAVLCRFAEKFLPDASLAEDIVQETFIKLWKSGKDFDSPEGLKSYLYTSTRNGCLDLIRSRTRLHHKHQQVAAGYEETAQPILAEMIRAESIALIYQVVKEMPEKMQQVFFLSYRDGMSVSEIATYLGISLKAVKKQKYKALVALRGRFAQHQDPWVIALAAMMLH
jgi:RNA polymerase sigma-70 factor (ECF subfamily)